MPTAPNAGFIAAQSKPPRVAQFRSSGTSLTSIRFVTSIRCLALGGDTRSVVALGLAIGRDSDIEPNGTVSLAAKVNLKFLTLDEREITREHLPVQADPR
jgi:hypothetical protein